MGGGWGSWVHSTKLQSALTDHIYDGVHTILPLWLSLCKLTSSGVIEQSNKYLERMQGRLQKLYE